MPGNLSILNKALCLEVLLLMLLLILIQLIFVWTQHYGSSVFPQLPQDVRVPNSYLIFLFIFLFYFFFFKSNQELRMQHSPYLSPVYAWN